VADTIPRRLHGHTAAHLAAHHSGARRQLINVSTPLSVDAFDLIRQTVA
jgi:hypothetical protein